MKKISLLLLYVFFYSCLGQNKSTNIILQQIKFKDNKLTKIISETSTLNTDCFEKNDFYVLDFFQSSFSNDEFFLSIDKFEIDEKKYDSLKYYVLINNRYYFISSKVSKNIFEILDSNKTFHIRTKMNSPGGDFNFLICKTSRAYAVLLNSCDE